ncbi:MAG TPA: permease-like cell division protein FtsX [Burkholderiales bacterium]|jgi:cell division transport system permease protein|nr:permease-like cell division protein FtsX [Burkholderiales bacterium]
MIAWLRQHRDAFGRAFGKLMQQRGASLLNALVIGVALSLPAGGYALLANLQGAAQRFTVEPQLSVFLRPEARRADLEPRLKANARIAQIRFVSRDEALRELRQAEGLAEVVAALERNPLPDAFVLRAREPSAAALEALAADLRALPGVARVQVDSAWAQRLGALARIGKLALAFLAALLATGLIAVTFNTIRLQILTLREEIEVSQLLGATDAFVRRPFLYLGVLQGLAGGILGLAVLWAGIATLNRPVRELAQTYGSDFQLALLPWPEAVVLLAAAALLGWLGALLSVSKYLR